VQVSRVSKPDLEEDFDKNETKCLAEKLKSEDSNTWKDLENEMEKELGKGRP